MRTFFLIIIAFFVFSCSSKREVPKGILPPDKMEYVLWDLIRTNEYLNSFVFNKDPKLDRTAEALKWYDNIYRVHNTTKAEFEKSYAYYREHPLLMKEVLDSMSRIKSPGAIKAAKDSIAHKDSLAKLTGIKKDSALLKDSLLRKNSLGPHDTFPKKRILPPAAMRSLLSMDSLKMRKRMLQR